MSAVVDRVKVEVEVGGEILSYELVADDSGSGIIEATLHVGIQEPDADVTAFGRPNSRLSPLSTMNLKLEASGKQVQLIRRQEPTR